MRFKALLLLLAIVLNLNAANYSSITKTLKYECDNLGYCFIENVQDIKYGDLKFDNCILELKDKYIICNSGRDSYHLKFNDFIQYEKDVILLHDTFLNVEKIDVMKLGGSPL